MIVLFDTNVILDHFLDRKPFSIHASYLFNAAEKGRLSGFLCATTITTIHYLTTKLLNAKSAKKIIKDLVTLFEIAPVNRSVLMDALNTHTTDYEDAVLQESALAVGIHTLVTRDQTDFKHAKLHVYSPGELVSILETTKTTS